MEEVTAELLSDMAMDPSFIHEWGLTSLILDDEYTAQSTQSNSSLQDSPANMLSFGGSSPRPAEEMGYCNSNEPTATRRMSQHAIAEKKRREHMAQKFIALSSIVPGLKKLDKATVLLDTINYIKQLKEKVEALEAQTANNSAEEYRCSSTESTVEVKVKISGKTALINIHCDDRKGILVKVFAEIERVGLSTISASSSPFASSFLDIVVLAEMEDGFSLQAHDIIEKLRKKLLNDCA